MALISSAEFIKNTSDAKAHRSPELRAIDAGLLAYEDAETHKGRFDAMVQLDAALTAFKDKMDAKYQGIGYLGSKREGADRSISKLIAQVDQESVTAAQCVVDIGIARKVCNRLLDVKIADVDFSPAVRQAAKAKQLPDGRSLYDTVKQDFDVAGAGAAPAKVGGKWPTVTGLASYDQVAAAPLQPRQSEAFRDHDKCLSAAKVLAPGRTMGAEGLKLIAETVVRHRYAVCESIAATVVHLCRQEGFLGRIEWIGIPYEPKIGHSIVLAHREGDTINDTSSWGNHWFFIDMWFYNLAMRNKFLWADDDDRYPFLNQEIYRYLGVDGGLKVMGAA